MLNKMTKKLFSQKWQKFSVADSLNLESLLDESEIEIMNSAREFCQSTLFPNITENYRKSHFDKSIMKKMGEMGFFGCTMTEYDGSGVSHTAYGLINREVERVDSSYRSAFSV